MAGPELEDFVATLDRAVTQTGERLAEMSAESPVLLVFLRHAGCTFCREALADIARARGAIDATGTRIVLVHMRDSGAMERLMEKYGIAELDRICDSAQRLYRLFGLGRARIRELFAPGVVWRGLHAGLLSGHGIGRVTADARQMPGLFLLDGAVIVRRFRHRTVADRPDYAGICSAYRKFGSWV
jgi:peroxiredoxin